MPFISDIKTVFTMPDKAIFAREAASKIKEKKVTQAPSEKPAVDSPEIVYARRISGKANLPEKLAALTSSGCMYVSKNMLFLLDEKLLVEPSVTLDQAQKIAAPQGTIKGLIAFNEEFLIFVENGNEHVIYKYNNGEWINISDKLGSSDLAAATYSRETSLLYFCLAESAAVIHTSDGEYEIESDDSICVYSLNSKYEIKRVTGLSCYFQAVYSMLAKGDELLVCGKGEKQSVCLKISLALADANPEKEPVGKVINLPIGVYRLVPKACENLFTVDGFSRVIDENGKTYFEDLREYSTGFQLAATARMATDGNEMIFLGSVRRNAAHPVACFYILKNGKEVYKYTDHVTLRDMPIWTGYSSIYNVENSEQLCFPCYGSSLLIIKKIKVGFFLKLLKYNRTIKTIYQDDTCIVLDQFYDMESGYDNLFQQTKTLFTKSVKITSIIYERFSLISKLSDFWSFYSSKMDYETYKNMILNPERINERLDIFLRYQLPLLKFASKNNNIFLYVMASEFLPHNIKNILNNVMQQYPFLKIDFFDDETPHNLKNTFSKYLSKFKDEQIICSIGRLDDDDLLHPVFFDNMKKYMHKDFLNFGISHTKGFAALYEDGHFVKFAKRRSFNTSQGLSVIAAFHEGKFISKYFYPVGSHSCLDERMPVIADGTVSAYIYTINGYNDSWRYIRGMDNNEVDNYFFNNKEEKFEYIDKLYFNIFSNKI